MVKIRFGNIRFWVIFWFSMSKKFFLGVFMFILVFKSFFMLFDVLLRCFHVFGDVLRGLQRRFSCFRCLLRFRLG